MFISSPFLVPSSLRAAGPCWAMRLLAMRTIRIEAWQPVSILAWPPEGDPIDAAEPGPIAGDPDTHPEGIVNVSSF